MSKKKTKKASKKRLAGGSNIEAEAISHLSAGRYRQAVDVFKQLHKKAPERHLDGLQAAYAGLYRQRLAKGMLDEAAMVLAQLNKLSPAAANAASLMLHLKRGQFAKAAEAAVHILSRSDGLNDEVSAAVDTLVTAFDRKAPLDDLSASMRSDLEGIYEALQKLSEGDIDGALKAVKSISIRSAFSSWKWLVKGMCAFYAHDDPKAIAALEKIRPQSAPALTAKPFLDLIQSAPLGDATAKDTFLTANMCRIAGFEAEAEAIARAQYLWTINRHRDSHAHLVAALPAFPSITAGLSLTLSELYYNRCFDLPKEQGFDYLKKITLKNGRSHPAEDFWAQRTLALFSEQINEMEAIILEQWENFISICYSVAPDDSRGVQRLVYGHVGDLFSRETQGDAPFGFFPFRRRGKGPILRNAELAEYCYNAAIEASPDTLQPQLSLAAFLEKTGESSRLNKLLDQMIRQFPGEKEVLTKAGLRCLARKAYVKAMKYLEQASALDPTDQHLQQRIIRGCILSARQYSKKGVVDKARALLVRALETAEAHLDHFYRGHAYLYARWSAMALVGHRDAEAEDLWQQAMATRGCGELKLHLFYALICACWGVPESRCKTHHAYIKKKLKGPFSSDAAIDCIRIANFNDEGAGIDMLPDDLAALVLDFLSHGASTDMPRQQAVEIVGYLVTKDGDGTDIATGYVNHWLTINGDDARFRFYRFLMDYPPQVLMRRTEQAEKELKTIIALAGEQRDTDVLEQAPKFSGWIKEAASLNDYLNPFLDDDDDWMDDDDDDWMDDETLFPPLPIPRPKRRSAQDPATGNNEQLPKKSKQLDLF
ncbi:MAG: hypothetical protein HKP58_12900 [Desulfatitalea sp.]|nr:hypothetical protein [Desulfatitalea sp.]NNK01298.1 hypothetical protein [Desulfatitalea sp.]